MRICPNISILMMLNLSYFFYLFENKYLLKTHGDEWVHVICICFPSSLHSNVTIHWFKHGIWLPNIFLYPTGGIYIRQYGRRSAHSYRHFILFNKCKGAVMISKEYSKGEIEILKISTSKIGRDERPLSHWYVQIIAFCK